MAPERARWALRPGPRPCGTRSQLRPWRATASAKTRLGVASAGYLPKIHSTLEGGIMGDKTRAKVDQMSGKIKEGVGSASDDDKLKREGQREQAKGDVREAAGKVKDAARDATGR
jgi:uncharacterized protein YjbJ (UPF0337 family)